MSFKQPYSDIPLMKQSRVMREALFTEADLPISLTSPLQKWDLVVGMVLRVEARTTAAGTRAISSSYRVGSSYIMFGDNLVINNTSFTRYEVNTISSNLASVAAQSTTTADEVRLLLGAGAASFEARNAVVTIIYIPYVHTAEVT